MTPPNLPAGQPGPVALTPVALAWAANIAVALVTAFVPHLTGAEVGAVDAIAAAAVAVVTACMARPWYIPGITGAATSALTAAAAFGLHWTPEQIGAAVAALSLVLMLATHQAVIPAAAAKRGLLGTEILLARELARHGEPPGLRPPQP